MYPTTFHDKLRYAREKAGYTQEEVAKVIHVSRTTFTNYELGYRKPTLDTLALLCDFLCVSADWLLGTQGGKNV
ncbi:MAG: helix-turn-helix transcriptional regulator [Clostridia bacterium]|nr:helix-turn-helix transcriptional regulator [Clostridia bacterium]